MKVCSKCKVVKELDLFKKDTRRKDGCSSQCKECSRLDGNNYYNRTKDDRRNKINENRRKSYSNNKEIENEKSRVYKIENSDKIKEYNRDYQIENRKILSEKAKEYYKNNKDILYIKHKEYVNNKLKNDELFRLKHYMRSMIRKKIKQFGYTKKSKTNEILGCSFEEFKTYLESKFETWMNWDNHGLYNGELNYGWDIDHTIPLSSAKTEEDIIRLNHYTNLKPLCSYINRVVKSSKLDFSH